MFPEICPGDLVTVYGSLYDLHGGVVLWSTVNFYLAMVIIGPQKLPSFAGSRTFVGVLAGGTYGYAYIGHIRGTMTVAEAFP